MSDLEKLRDILARDAELVGWCVETYGRAPLIVVGLDDENPADPETDYPLLALEPVENSTGNASPRETRSVMLAAGVRQPARDQSVEASGARTVTSRGVLDVERLRELALRAIFLGSAGLGKIEADGDAQASSMHPIYLSFCALRLERPRQPRR